MTDSPLAKAVAWWPFAAHQQKTPDQRAKWHEHCYHPPKAAVMLFGSEHSVVVMGPPGSGKSVLMEAYMNQTPEPYLMVPYPPSHWPGASHAWTPDPEHLTQILATISVLLRKRLTENPALMENFEDIDLEYLRWLIEKYNGRRIVRRWADSLQHPTLSELLENPFKDIYPEYTIRINVQFLLEELVAVCEKLGVVGVALIIDIDNNHPIDEQFMTQLTKLFSWLTALQVNGFVIKAALPEKLYEAANLQQNARGRTIFMPLKWTAEACRTLACTHLSLATDGELTNLFEIASEAVVAALEEEMLTLHEQPTPRIWLQLTQLLLQRYLAQNAPASIDDLAGLLREYYAQYVSLRFDEEEQGVWLAKRFIFLDDSPFAFVKTLWDNRTHSNNINQMLLNRVAGNQGYLNTLASRVRKKIEPVPKEPIYILNSRAEGYWLDNYHDELTSE